MTSYTFSHTDIEGSTTCLSFGGEEYTFWPEVLSKFMVFLNANGFHGVEERIALLDGFEPLHSWRGRTFVEADEADEAEEEEDSNWVWNDPKDAAPW